MVDCGERIQERPSDDAAQSCLRRRKKVYLAWLTFVVLCVPKANRRHWNGPGVEYVRPGVGGRVYKIKAPGQTAACLA
jgi:hypothetical protein